MTTKTLLASVTMMALTLLRSPAQIPQAPSPSPIPDQITVNVLGEVNKPSRIALPRGGTLLDAVAAAEGFTRMANTSKILLIHKTMGEKPDSVRIDLRPILAGIARDVTLRDGDTVVVGQAIF
jgi:protein involved in polysaccharide export with SLBB domain